MEERTRKGWILAMTRKGWQVLALLATVWMGLMGGACSNKEEAVNKAKAVVPNMDTLLDYSHTMTITLPKGMKAMNRELDWDIAQEIVLRDSFPKSKRDPRYKVFGWHPYFMGSSYKSYDFDLLWGVSYFGYVVDTATGNPASTYQWQQTELVDMAHEKGCRVYMTLVNFGQSNNRAFLNDKSKWANCLDTLVKLLKLKGADGVNIDFEEVSAGDKKALNECIIYLSKGLKKANKNYGLSLCLFAVDWNKVFDIKKIRAHVDFYTLMGYDYYYRGSTSAGPVSPLRKSKDWGNYSIEESIKYYTKAGVAKNRLILGLPYYGAEWVVQDTNQVPSRTRRFATHRVYRKMRQWLEVGGDTIAYSKQLNTAALTRKYQYTHPTDSTQRQIWTDDKYTLSVKMEWAKKQKLGGVAIWSLGYDNGYYDLWDMMRGLFAKK